MRFHTPTGFVDTGPCVPIDLPLTIEVDKKVTPMVVRCRLTLSDTR